MNENRLSILQTCYDAAKAMGTFPFYINIENAYEEYPFDFQYLNEKGFIETDYIFPNIKRYATITANGIDIVEEFGQILTQEEYDKIKKHIIDERKKVEFIEINTR